jgi:hypothetical protein
MTGTPSVGPRATRFEPIAFALAVGRSAAEGCEEDLAEILGGA